jgi:ketosteroid isomerase-like protein
MRPSTVLLTIVTSLTAASPALAQESASADSVAVGSVVTAFHAALVEGDSVAALRLLAADLCVLESGRIEDLTEYRSHHLAADIAFAQAVPSERKIHAVTVIDSVAWLSATSRTSGTYRGRTIDSDGAELMVLTRTPDGWRIRAIHWSSRARRRE